MFRYPVAWTRVTWLTVLLVPLAWVFGAVTAARRALYRARPALSVRLPVPVIVVGNISVGGTGKTPLVLWLAARLREAGWQPGIISRGYAGNAAQQPGAVQPGDDPATCGDEPVLLARRSQCPVLISSNRVAAARALLAAHPACNVLISDDGLQHYRLARDVEIAVLDATRKDAAGGESGLGNGWLLPAGPLREPPSRLARVDAIVVRGQHEPVAAHVPPRYGMTLTPTGFYPLRDATIHANAQHFQSLRVHAVAGIGHPQQFFDTLTRMGVAHVPHAFPDHHPYRAADITFDACDAVVMTEKDAVKCERFAADHHRLADSLWVLQADAEIHGTLLQHVLKRLSRKP